MALTNAERQKKLRLKRKTTGRMLGEVGHERLDIWLVDDRKFELEVLAALHGTTLRETLDSLIGGAAERAKANNKNAWAQATSGVLEMRRVTG